MKFIQRIEIVTEVTEEDCKGLNIVEFKKELYELIKNESEEGAVIKISLALED